MTISSETVTTQTAGNGTTTRYYFTFTIYEDTDLLVKVINDTTEAETELTLNSDYTVSVSGKYIDLTSGSLCPTGSTMNLISNIPYTQETELQDGGDWSASVFNFVFDKLTRLILQLKAAIVNFVTLDDVKSDSAIASAITLKHSNALDHSNSLDHSNALDHSNTLDHVQNSDTYLNFGGGNQVSAAQAKTAYTHSQTASGNPHGVTKSDVGLGNVDNKSEATIISDVKADSDVADAISKKHDASLHIAHSLATAVNDFLVASGAGAFVKKTLAEVKIILGLGSAAYTASTDYAAAGHNHSGTYEPANSNIQNHISSTSNPHSVTKTQVGLSNVDNTQQLPASYLDTDNTLASNSDSKVPSQKAVKTYADTKAPASHNHSADAINSGTLDGDRLPAISTTKKGAVPATGTPSGKFLKDDGSWAAVSGTGDVVGPATNTDGKIPQWNGENSKTLKDGLSVVTSVGSLGADTNIPTEQAVREAISAAGGGDVTGPASSTDNAITRFDGTGGKTIQNSSVTIDDNGSINIPAGQSYKIDGAALAKGNVGLGNVDNVQQMPLSYLDTDSSLTANSDSKVPSQKAIKAYCDNLLAANDAMVYKGVIDCSSNPNYPAASQGHTYRISVAGKIGGASGANVEIGDAIICITDTAAGTQAAVGSNWTIVQSNIDGAVIGPASSTDNGIVRFDSTTGKLVQNSLVTIDDSGSVNIPSGQKYKINNSDLSYSDVGAAASGHNHTGTYKAVGADETANVTAASDSAAGKVELATSAETNAGTDGTRALTPDGFAGSNFGIRYVEITITDSTALTTGDGKAYFRVPAGLNGMNLVSVAAHCGTASSSGTPTFQVNNVTDSVDMLSTALTIDANENDSSTAATAAVIDTTKDDVVTGDWLRIDCDTAGTGTAWVVVELGFQLP